MLAQIWGLDELMENISISSFHNSLNVHTPQGNAQTSISLTNENSTMYSSFLQFSFDVGFSSNEFHNIEPKIKEPTL